MSLKVKFEAHHKTMYADNVKQVAQQKSVHDKIRGAVTSVPAEGEAMSAADLIGSVEAQEDNGIDRRNIENPPSASRRWLTFPNRVRSGQYIDKQDKMKRAMDPTSVYVKAHTLAVKRALADKILGVRKVSKGVFEIRDGGILGTAVDGKTPGGSKVALPNSCYTPAGGTGMVLNKLLGAKEALNLEDFGLEDDTGMYCAISPLQVTDLLNIAAAAGQNLNTFEQQQLKDGKPTVLIGFTWIVTNRLPRDGNGDRLCPIWSEDNILEGVWQDVQGDMWLDTANNNTPYAQVDAYTDVVRVEDNGVHVITCQE